MNVRVTFVFMVESWWKLLHKNRFQTNSVNRHWTQNILLQIKYMCTYVPKDLFVDHKVFHG